MGYLGTAAYSYVGRGGSTVLTITYIQRFSLDQSGGTLLPWSPGGL
jgi:hypothetical protein